jgi:hypothetical protein
VATQGDNIEQRHVVTMEVGDQMQYENCCKVAELQPSEAQYMG